MKTNWMIALLTICTVGLMGCGQKYADVSHTLPSIAADHGRIFFYRDHAPFGVAIMPEIKLNGEVVGNSVHGSFYYLDKPAGNYEVSTSYDDSKNLQFTLAAGEQKYVRTRVMPLGDVNPYLEPEEKAIKTLRGAYWTTPTGQMK